ncbi:hypothetical protein GCM10022234_04430 [Aeromicrobium panaciterrae]|uniref:TetR/AcrR family transcriptional regulator n=1 Tax=Aeromicrobium panaciterrae TaxID=363861 RepID=UPI0031CED83C
MTTSAETTQRADARRNRAAIIEAATRCLAVDPAATLGEIAEKAGVGRVTLYAHFGSRVDLIREVVTDALATSNTALESVDLTGDPAEAMSRLLEASWHVTHQFGGLVVAAESALAPAELRDAHEQPAQRVQALLRRGRKDGSFRTDVPVPWQLDTIQAVIHAASGAVHRGAIREGDATGLIQKTVLAALKP